MHLETFRIAFDIVVCFVQPMCCTVASVGLPLLGLCYSVLTPAKTLRLHSNVACCALHSSGGQSSAIVSFLHSNILPPKIEVMMMIA